MIAYRDSIQSTNATTTTTVSAVIPATAKVNDLAVIFFADGDNSLTHTLSPSSGWTQHYMADGLSNGSMLTVAAWSKVLAFSDIGSTVTITSTNTVTTKRTLNVVVYSGATTGATAQQFSAVASTTHTAPAVTAVSANAWLVQQVADRASPGSSSFSFPGTLTQRQFFAHSGGAGVSSVITDQANTGSGSVGAYTYTGTVSTKNASQMSIALEPASLDAYAGEDQTQSSAASVNLEGYGTGGSGSYTYLWTQTAGTTVTINNSTSATASFTAPTVASTTTLTFQLEANDGVVTATDSVSVTIDPAPATAFFSESFDGGTDGVAASTTNTDFTATGGLAPVFTNNTSNAISGLSVRCDTTSTPTRNTLEYSFSSAQNNFYERWYYQVDALPGSSSFIASVLDGVTALAFVRLNTDGTISIRNGTLAVATTITAVTPKQPFRLGWHLNASGTTQSLSIYAGENVHGTTPTETISGTFNTGTPNRAQFGIVASPATSWVTWLDAVELDSSSEPGPLSDTNVVLTVGSKQDIEPGDEVEADSTAYAGSSPYTYVWSQTAGTTVVLDDSTAADPKFIAPGVDGGSTVVLQCVVTDSDSKQTTTNASFEILSPIEWSAVGGVWKFRRMHNRRSEATMG